MNSQPTEANPTREPYELTDRDRQILAFAGQWFRHVGSREDAIREQFDLSPTRFYQILNALIDRSEALAAEPMVVKRLRRLREERAQRRR